MEPYTYFTDEISVPLEGRFRHMAILGATGSGKSSLLLRLALGDVENGHGLCLIDPHSSLCNDLLNRLPPDLANRVAYIDFSDLDFAVGIDFLSAEPHMVGPTADALVSAMHSVWHASWGPELERTLRHALIALIESGHNTLALLPRLLTDQAFRNRVVPRVKNPFTRAFFEMQYDAWSERLQAEKSASTINKIEALLISEATSTRLGQKPGTFKFEKALEIGQIVVVNLDHARLKSNVDTVAALIISRLLTAASKRTANDPNAIPVHLIVDEASRVGGLVLQDVLQDARKYRLSATIASQAMANLDPAVQDAILGNVHTLAAFSVAAKDAELLAPRFDRLHEEFNPHALLDLAPGEAYLSIKGRDTCRVQFPLPPSPHGRAQLFAVQSRNNFAKPLAYIQAGINRTCSGREHKRKVVKRSPKPRYLQDIRRQLDDISGRMRGP